MNTARAGFSRSRNSNSSFSFWWWFLQLNYKQQKNMMVQLGHQWNPLNTARKDLAGCRNSNSRFSFWWLDTPPTFTATEEYDGQLGQLVKFKYSKRYF
jgi:hypothetical protein